MAIVRKYGKPHLFVTYTATSSWTEINESMFSDQDQKERPDLVAGAFSQRLKELLDDLLKKDALGLIVAIVLVIEWQKRGLPHAHILLTLAGDDSLHTPSDVDKILSAQIPDKKKNPKLFELVSKFMVHGPCGAANPNSPCMVKGKCSKGYPMPLQKYTTLNPDTGVCVYARPSKEDGGNTMTIWCNERKEFITIDNQWIVPYNPVLLLKYQAHMNVERCNSTKACKYVYKYIAKGPDRIMLELDNPDEIQQFIDTQYTSASQAEWELQGNPISIKVPDVIKLPCHLENEQFVVFNEEDNINEVIDRNSETMLTAAMKLFSNDPNASDLTYEDIPGYYR